MRLLIAHESPLLLELLQLNIERSNLEVNRIMTTKISQGFLTLLEKGEYDVVMISNRLSESDEKCLQAILKFKGKKIILASGTRKWDMEGVHVNALTLFDVKNDTWGNLVSVLKNNEHGFYISPTIIKVYFAEQEKLTQLRLKGKNTAFDKRRQKILWHICDGKSSEEIAKVMLRSKRTIDGDRTMLMKLTGSKNTAQLVVFAIKNRIYTIDD